MGQRLQVQEIVDELRKADEMGRVSSFTRNK